MIGPATLSGYCRKSRDVRFRLDHEITFIGEQGDTTMCGHLRTVGNRAIWPCGDLSSTRC
jgi:hypothetical protein